MPPCKIHGGVRSTHLLRLPAGHQDHDQGSDKDHQKSAEGGQEHLAHVSRHGASPTVDELTDNAELFDGHRPGGHVALAEPLDLGSVLLSDVVLLNRLHSMPDSTGEESDEDACADEELLSHIETP